MERSNLPSALQVLTEQRPEHFQLIQLLVTCAHLAHILRKQVLSTKENAGLVQQALCAPLLESATWTMLPPAPKDSCARPTPIQETSLRRDALQDTIVTSARAPKRNLPTFANPVLHVRMAQLSRKGDESSAMLVTTAQ